MEELEFDACFVPQESSSSEEEEEEEEQSADGDNPAMAIEAMVVPPQVRMAQRVIGHGKRKEAHPSALLSRGDFEMPDLYERIKMYMKMLFDFIRTHPHIKGKDNERAFSFVLRRAINVLNNMVRQVAPTPNRIVLEKEVGAKYSKLWERLVKITSFMYDYDEAFEMLAKTYAYYNQRPVRHNAQVYSLRSLTSLFLMPMSSMPETSKALTPSATTSSSASAESPASSTTTTEETAFVPKLSKLEFEAINQELIALHEFLVGASADRMAHVNMTRFNESAENDPWYYPKKKAF